MTAGISAIMPVFNSERYVKETIDSILNQSYTDFEFIIVNDGSTDKTREIIEGYNDKRIKLYNLEVNKGVGYASNFAVQKTVGKYIARVDSDDIYHKDRFLLQKKFLDKNPDIALVKSFYEYFADEDLENKDRFYAMKNIIEKNKNEIISPEDIAEKLYWDMCIPNNSTMIRSEVMKEFGYEDMRCGEDYYLFYNMNKKGYKMGTIAECLVKTRVSNNSITAQNKYECYESVCIIKKDIIEPLFMNNNVYIWGAGSFGILVYEILQKNSYNIRGFIDSDTSKHGRITSGLKVYSPDILIDKEEIKIIVASQPGKYSIVKELERIGYRHLKDYIVYL